MTEPTTLTYSVSREPFTRPEYPSVLLGSAEGGDDLLTLRRQDRANPPGSNAETISTRLMEAWRPFLHRLCTHETYDAMAEAAKAAFVDFLHPDIIATFEVNASHHSTHGVDLTMRNPPGNIPTHIASLLPAEIAQVTTWGRHW